jgi:hypothetical protein
VIANRRKPQQPAANMFSFSPSIVRIVRQRRPRRADSTECPGCRAGWEVSEIARVIPPVIFTDYCVGLPCGLVGARHLLGGLEHPSEVAAGDMDSEMVYDCIHDEAVAPSGPTRDPPQ